MASSERPRLRYTPANRSSRTAARTSLTSAEPSRSARSPSAAASPSRPTLSYRYINSTCAQRHGRRFGLFSASTSTASHSSAASRQRALSRSILTRTSRVRRVSVSAAPRACSSPANACSASASARSNSPRSYWTSASMRSVSSASTECSPSARRCSASNSRDRGLDGPGVPLSFPRHGERGVAIAAARSARPRSRRLCRPASTLSPPRSPLRPGRLRPHPTRRSPGPQLRSRTARRAGPRPAKHSPWPPRGMQRRRGRPVQADLQATATRFLQRAAVEGRATHCSPTAARQNGRSLATGLLHPSSPCRPIAPRPGDSDRARPAQQWAAPGHHRPTTVASVAAAAVRPSLPARAIAASGGVKQNESLAGVPDGAPLVDPQCGPRGSSFDGIVSPT